MQIAEKFLDLLGLPTSLLITFGAIVGAFAYIEKISSKKAKQDLTAFLRSANWNQLISQMPAQVRSLFEGIFGDRHFSTKCLRRSLMFSISSIFILLSIAFLRNYDYFWSMPRELVQKPGVRIIFGGWLIFAILLDYLNLFKTRIVIRIFGRTHLPLIVFPLLILSDLILSFLIFALIIDFLQAVNVTRQIFEMATKPFTAWDVLRFLFVLSKHLWLRTDILLDNIANVTHGPIANEFAVMFFSSLLPSLWLVLYVCTIILTRIMLRLTGAMRFATYFLDVDHHPIRSIGIIAATLVVLITIVKTVGASLV